MAIPEFILRKLFVRESLQIDKDGFSFALHNTFAPGTITGLALEVDGQPVPPEGIVLQVGDEPPRDARSITPQASFPLPVGVDLTIQVRGTGLGQGHLTVHAGTREAGPLVFTVQAGKKGSQRQARRTLRLPRFLRRPLQAEVEVDAGAVIGEVHPYVYGHFVEHLERCVYGGIWTEDGSRLREDTLPLIRALRPPVTRYPGGNFASGYHWEDGIGPREQRPRRHDEAWHAWESNQVGTDEFLAFCAQAGTDPFLVVNDGSGTPEEAARWVAYCNDPPGTEQGDRRAANGHPEPYDVRLWGVGNEVWGRWQVGHTDAAGYVTRLRPFVAAMREADPDVRLVAVGDRPLTGDPDDGSSEASQAPAQDPGRRWNETVLREAGDLIDYLSFHIYQPGEEGWRENYDLEPLHHTICAAPLDVERSIRRLAKQIKTLVPERKVQVALDEWNLQLPAPEGATMHQVAYTLRDGLYAAGMLNVFHRQCDELTLANLAQLVNVLPLIVTDERRAYATPIYYPFLLYREMERLALRPHVDGPAFDSEGLGNIAPHRSVPYLDVTATRDEAGRRVVLGVVNRHPHRPVRATVALRGFGPLQLVQAQTLSGPDPLAINDFDMPEQVRVREAPLPTLHSDRFIYRFPASSVTVLVLATGG